MLNGEKVGRPALHVVIPEALPFITWLLGLPWKSSPLKWVEEEKDMEEGDTWKVFVGQA